MSLFDVRPDWSGYNVINVGTQQASLTDLGNIFTCHWSLSRFLRNKLLRIELIIYYNIFKIESDSLEFLLTK